MARCEPGIIKVNLFTKSPHFFGQAKQCEPGIKIYAPGGVINIHHFLCIRFVLNVALTHQIRSYRASGNKETFEKNGKEASEGKR